MLMEYEGPGNTNLTYTKKIDGSNFIVARNENWSAKDSEFYDVTLSLNGKEYSTKFAVGVRSNQGSGLVIKVNDFFETDFSQGYNLHIFLNNLIIDRLSLHGTSAALLLVNKCLADLKRQREEEEVRSRRWANLPEDPFSSGAKKDDSKAHPPIPFISPAMWIYSSDYPAKALREKRSGTVFFLLNVSQMGRVTKCEITESSGSPDLDEATCAHIAERAYFRPAVDGDGARVAGQYSNSIHWTVAPDD